jgi:hypothetical protein
MVPAWGITIGPARLSLISYVIFFVKPGGER